MVATWRPQSLVCGVPRRRWLRSRIGSTSCVALAITAPARSSETAVRMARSRGRPLRLRLRRGRLDDVEGAPDDQRRERLADELLHERHVLDLHLPLAASRCDLGQPEALDLILGGKVLLVGVACEQRRAGDAAQGGVFLTVLDGVTVEVLDHGGEVDFHGRSTDRVDGRANKAFAQTCMPPFGRTKSV